jgi:hypothetical protein
VADTPYIRFRINTKKPGFKEPVIRLYPLPCLHIGAPQSDAYFIKQHINRIRQDPQGFWIYMGDGGECVTPGSKGSIFEQLYNPQQQQGILISLLEPIKKQGLFGIRGNHGNRVYKETGLSFDKTLCARLGIPYQGVNSFCNLVVNRSSYDLYCHHGVDSGAKIQSKVSSADKFRGWIIADATITAHSHTAMEIQPAAYLLNDNNECRVRTKLMHQYIAGCGYDSRESYATDKGYSPLMPAFICIEFDGRIIEGRAQKNQHYRRWFSDGQHKVDGDYGKVKLDIGG